MDGMDLRKFQEGDGQKQVAGILGKILSGRDGYEAVIEKRKEVRRCQKCNWALEGGEKFCPECGSKT
jgi:rRNA maturation endonuclease Nob1